MKGFEDLQEIAVHLMNHHANKIPVYWEREQAVNVSPHLIESVLVRLVNFDIQ